MVTLPAQSIRASRHRSGSHLQLGEGNGSAAAFIAQRGPAIHPQSGELLTVCPDPKPMGKGDPTGSKIELDTLAPGHAAPPDVGNQGYRAEEADGCEHVPVAPAERVG